jgi:hypothetical protein
MDDELPSEFKRRWVVSAAIDRPLRGLEQETSNEVALYVILK